MSEKDGEIVSRGRVDRELDELHTVEHWGVGKRSSAGFRLDEDQRAQSVASGQACWSRAEFVIEDLERERAPIAGGQHRSQKTDDIEIALSGEVAEMPAPRQQVSRHQWSVGELNKEEFFSRQCSDPGQVVFERQRMKAVQHQPERGVVRVLYDLPRLRPTPDVTTPGQGFVGDAQAATRGALGECSKVRGRSRRIVDRRGVDIAADEHQIGAERLHDVEFAFGAFEISRALRLRHRLEIPERLKSRNGQTELSSDPLHFGRIPVKSQKVVFEELDTVEPNRRCSFELFR